jgi:lambda family phage tail tape measure protein
MEDSLVSFLQTGKFNMTNFANSVIADILRIKVNAFMTQAADTASSSGWFKTIFGALLGSMGGGAAAASSGPSAAAGGGSWLGDTSSYSLNARSFDGGGYTGDGARSGGLDGKGGFWAMLHPQETVVDHTKGQTTGGDVNVSITVNSDGSGREESGDNSSAMQLGRNIESSVMSVIIREKRPGGLLS